MRLDEIDESTPHRFRIWLANPAEREATLAALTTPIATGEISVVPVGGHSDRAGVDVASTFSPRTAAILRPLYALDRAGIAVGGLEALDLEREVDEGDLVRTLLAWDRFGNNGPYRRRLEILAGSDLIETCLERLRGAAAQGRGAESPRSAVWRFAVSCVAVNTAGSEARMLRAAVDARDEMDAQAFVDAAIHRATLASLAAEPFDPPEDDLVALIGRRSYLGERAAALAQSMTAPLPESIVGALCAAARFGGAHGATAVGALERAAPSESVRRAVGLALATTDTDLQAAALGILAHHWGAEARPTWQAFLASRSAPLRQTAEAVLGLHGTADDVPDAAAHLARLARTKSAVSMSPPRGAEIVDLLARHRDLPEAAAGLDDLSARWDRLGDDLREWLEQHHEWLDPARRRDEPLEGAAEPEGPLDWPPPTIERDGATLTLWFAETGVPDIRERFESLVMSHPRVEVIDGDREWAALKVSGDDPDALILDLWQRAGAPGSSGRPVAN